MQFLPEKILVETGHWPKIAQLWKQVGPPLRPSEQDIGFVKGEINSWTTDNDTPRALILGVTPELYNLPWPKGTNLLAVDHTQSMIDAVWPGSRNTTICTDWSTMPLQKGSRNIVLCDGGVHLMDYPNSHRKFIQTLHRIIAPGGLCIFRFFVPPKKHETPKNVLKDLFELKIPNLNILKLRLGMALQKNIKEGVKLKKVWDTLHRAAPDFHRLAERIGWPLEHLLVINTYRDSSDRYYFLSLADVRHLFCKSPGGFKLETIRVPTYALGECCPTVVFRRSDIRR